MVEKLTIEIPKKDILSDVHFRTYYQGESLKRKDVDFVSVQTSSDDEDILGTFLETALNEICGKMIKRVQDFTWENSEDNVKIELYPYKRIPESDAAKVTKLLQKSILDYVSNRCVVEWLLVVNPKLVSSASSRSERLEWEVFKHIGMISQMTRRRATDLAGI